MGIKDKLMSFLVEKLGGRMIKDLGTVNNFKLDSKNKTIEISVDLKGEVKPLDIYIRQYKVVETGKDVHFVVKKIEFSREWLNVIGEKFIVDRLLEIPGKKRSIVKLLL